MSGGHVSVSLWVRAVSAYVEYLASVLKAYSER